MVHSAFRCSSQASDPYLEVELEAFVHGLKKEKNPNKYIRSFEINNASPGKKAGTGEAVKAGYLLGLLASGNISIYFLL